MTISSLSSLYRHATKIFSKFSTSKNSFFGCRSIFRVKGRIPINRRVATVHCSQCCLLLEQDHVVGHFNHRNGGGWQRHMEINITPDNHVWSKLAQVQISASPEILRIYVTENHAPPKWRYFWRKHATTILGRFQPSAHHQHSWSQTTALKIAQVCG